MTKTTILKVIFIILLIPSSLLAQVTKDVPNYFPVSPNAASFAKPGLFPVDYSTGKINISIPIYTIKTKELTVPINLSYNSAGIQLDELASWVGLGWNLNAGGAIVRNVKGIPDNGTPIPDLSNLSFNAQSYAVLYNQFKADPRVYGDNDTAYDEFIVNAPGLSGTYYFVNNKAVFKDLQNTVVKFINNQQTIEITKDDGTIYHFGVGLDSQDATESVSQNNSSSNLRTYVTSWFLKEIIPPNSKSPNDNIYFYYKNIPSVIDYPIVTGESLIGSFNASSSSAYLKSMLSLSTISNKLFLESIKFNNGIIKFTSAKDRIDLGDDYKLDKISVFRTNQSSETLLQEYSFVYDYYNRSGGYITTANPYYMPSQRDENSRSKSLRLLQLKNNILNTKHTFEYESTTLPIRGTTQKDYWGYINNNSGNLTPATLLRRTSDYANQDGTITIGNGNRSANEARMKSGILQKITYPEGGYSSFEYEANRYIENVTTPVIAYRNASVAAFGKGCTNPNLPSFESKTFTTNNYISGSGEISINFMPATQESGGTANVTFDGQAYYRPLPFTAGGSLYMKKEVSGTHTITANEYRSGNIGANGCPITSINVSWSESAGSTTTPTTKFIGGLRIKSIKNYDGKNSNPITTKQFLYENENVLVKEGNGTYVRGMFELDVKSDIIPVLSTSAIFDNNTGGSPAITYGKVTEFDTDIQNSLQNGKTEYLYENIPSSRLFEIYALNLPTLFKSPFFNINQSFNIGLPLQYLTNFAFYKNDLWNQGSLLRTNTYKNGGTPNTFKLIKSVVNQYTILKESALSYNVVFNNFPSQQTPGDYPASFNLPYVQGNDYYSGQFYYAVGKTSQGKKVITNTIDTDYDSNENPTTQKTTTYSYENPAHYQVTKTETKNSKAETLKTKLSYPQDLVSTEQSAEMQGLINQNKIDKPIKTETFVNDVQTSESNTKYELSSATGNLLLPKEIHTSKGLIETFPFNDTNRKINFTLYDTDVVNGVTAGNGNVLEYSIENGTPVSIIWGYNKTQPIAKIENASYSQVAPYVSNLQNYSNTSSEANLISALNALRTSLPDAMITTYTYIPLVGVSTITDPKRQTTTYTYDSFGRLEFVKDNKGNILSENQYNYKQ